MRTDDLVALLAHDPSPVDPRAALRGTAAGLLLASASSLAMMLALLGPRADIARAAALPMFWLKLAFPVLTAGLAFVLLRRLGIPGMRTAPWARLLVLPALAVVLLACWRLASAPDGTRVALVMGSAGWLCPVTIGLLSVPAFALAFRAIGRLAPTRLVAAGAVAGLFAGSAAAAAYALYCPEMQAPYIAVWYTLGMLVPATAGAALGPRLLRW